MPPEGPPLCFLEFLKVFWGGGLRVRWGAARRATSLGPKPSLYFRVCLFCFVLCSVFCYLLCFFVFFFVVFFCFLLFWRVCFVLFSFCVFVVLRTKSVFPRQKLFLLILQCLPLFLPSLSHFLFSLPLSLSSLSLSLVLFLPSSFLVLWINHSFFVFPCWLVYLLLFHVKNNIKILHFKGCFHQSFLFSWFPVLFSLSNPLFLSLVCPYLKTLGPTSPNPFPSLVFLFLVFVCLVCVGFVFVVFALFLFVLLLECFGCLGVCLFVCLFFSFVFVRTWFVCLVCIAVFFVMFCVFLFCVYLACFGLFFVFVGVV